MEGDGLHRRVAFVLLLVVAASIPLRARREFGGANLEHQGIGLSRWLVDAEGARYRTAGPISTLFVPGDASVITVPLRALSPQGVLEVQMYSTDVTSTVSASRRTSGESFRWPF